jgi:hypothetical protein
MRIQALTFVVQVEVEPGFKRLYKQSYLRQELLSLRLPPNLDGSLREAFIDGAHAILMGPGRGNVQILFQNMDMNEIFVDRFSGSFATHLLVPTKGKRLRFLVLSKNVV